MNSLLFSKNTHAWKTSLLTRTKDREFLEEYLPYALRDHTHCLHNNDTHANMLY